MPILVGVNGPEGEWQCDPVVKEVAMASAFASTEAGDNGESAHASCFHRFNGSLGTLGKHRHGAQEGGHAGTPEAAVGSGPLRIGTATARPGPPRG